MKKLQVSIQVELAKSRLAGARESRVIPAEKCGIFETRT